MTVKERIQSLKGKIRYAAESSCHSFIICTENGVMHELRKQDPDKEFYLADESFSCPGMKRITLEKVLDVLEHQNHKITVDEQLRKDSMIPLERMLKLG